MAGFDRRRRAGIDAKLTYLGRGSIRAALFDSVCIRRRCRTRMGRSGAKLYEMLTTRPCWRRWTTSKATRPGAAGPEPVHPPADRGPACPTASAAPAWVYFYNAPLGKAIRIRFRRLPGARPGALSPSHVPGGLARTTIIGAVMPASATATVHQNYIDGRWTPAVTGDTFENRNPANTDDLIGIFQQSGAADVTAALTAAARAYETWRLVPAPRRAEMLFRAAQIIVDRKEEFARDMTREMGKVLNETRGDVQEAIDMTFYMAGEGRRMFGQTVPSELRNKFAMSIRQPLGVCSIITPWNFPMAIPSWKIIPALVCGNTVVFKPASQTPLSARQLRDGSRGGRHPAGRRQPRDRRWRRRRYAADDARIGAGRFVHRLDACRPDREPARRPVVQEGAPRDGRQERHHRDGRRRPRAGGRRLPVGRFRHQRAALHRGQPRRRAREGATSAFVERVRRARAARCVVGDGLRRGDADGAVDQRGAAQHRHEVRADRPGRGGDAAPAAATAHGGALREGLLPRADDFQRRRSHPCALRARRFSDRSSR